MNDWTYGVEHEWADWDIRTPLEGGVHNRKDGTIVNSNGIANDPLGRSYSFGGEINTNPTDTVEGQVRILEELLLQIPAARVNYRSNLHLHIRVPGLRDNLESLKKIQKQVVTELPFIISTVEPIERPRPGDFATEEELQGAIIRYKRCLRSHHTFPTSRAYSAQMKAKTVEEFFNAEAPRSKSGRYLHHLVSRSCVNLRQLMETDTVEFRHFPGTLNSQELEDSFRWCIHFLRNALEGEAPDLSILKELTLPRFQRYDHRLERGYQMTTFHQVNEKRRLTRTQIQKNINAILEKGIDKVLAETNTLSENS